MPRKKKSKEIQDTENKFKKKCKTYGNFDWDNESCLSCGEDKNTVYMYENCKKNCKKIGFKN